MTAEQQREENPSAEASEDGSTSESRDEAEAEASDAGNHLSDVPDGSGCAEIWEHLSEERDDDD